MTTTPPSRVSNRIFSLTHSTETVTTAFAASPTSSPRRLLKDLYHNHSHHRAKEKSSFTSIFNSHSSIEDVESSLLHDECPTGPTQKDLDRAAKCGDFGKRPSDLFLKVGAPYIFVIHPHRAGKDLYRHPCRD